MREDEFNALEDLFQRALSMPVEDRNAFLDSAEIDRTQRDQLRALLLAHERPAAFPGVERAIGDALDSVARDVAEPERADSQLVLGDGIDGRYRIVEHIADGGFGAVYAADQLEPVRRRVALKLLRSEISEPEVVTRFEVERQALAVMDHPCISKVYDAGTTSSGRPYFVMELVDGAPLTSYCDSRRLSIRDRLELFVKVCRAVQHAHQKGVIHRDIKPSNVLVAEQDGRATPTLIDFGIAKAVGTRLTEHTFSTLPGRLIGTPAYMSPEHFRVDADDVDARSDIYSLGVLLYELLAGVTPFDQVELLKRGFSELERHVRLIDPPKPSTRIARQSNREELARQRDATPRRLLRRLRGDLDWIVSRALEKEPSRRYASASALADDVERFLAHEPVEATPPSWGYRVAKFTRRHRTASFAAVAIVVALAAGVVASLIFAFDSRDNLELAEDRKRDLEQELAKVLRLADLRTLAEVEAEEKLLWPSDSSRIEPLKGWLEKARGLIGNRELHRATLEELRRRALPYTEEDRSIDLERTAIGDEQRSLRSRVESIDAAISQLENSGHSSDRVTVISFGPDSRNKHPAYYFRRTVDVSSIGARRQLEVSTYIDDGFVLYIDGEAVLRDNVPAGEIDRGVTAVKCITGLPTWKTFDVGFDPEGREQIEVAVLVLQDAPGCGDVHFDLELAARGESGDVGDSLVMLERGSEWRFDDSGGDPGADWTTTPIDARWKKSRAPFGYGYPDGDGRLAELRGARSRVRAKLDGLRAEVLKHRTWRFESVTDRWWHDAVAQLIDGLDRLETTEVDGESRKGLIPEVERRLEVARDLERRSTGGSLAARWRTVNEDLKARFHGRLMRSMEGYVPLGKDPESGLQEFAHLLSGDAPVTENTGLVFVLVPGGKFHMGAVKPKPGQRPGRPNVDPQAQSNEGPVHTVTLQPFLLSKYELTQGQWLRMWHENPSVYRAGTNWGHRAIDLRNPVENVSWNMSVTALARVGLTLPTEAQWEFAARAGTGTPWWTGSEKESLRRGENVADLAWRAKNPRSDAVFERWNDGHLVHATVGVFAANPWGFHDMLGNVSEWCLDEQDTYRHATRESDGGRGKMSLTVRQRLLGETPVRGARMMRRGGTLGNSSGEARVSARVNNPPDFRVGVVGLRPAASVRLE